jgi:hypothetical protein
MLVRAGDNEARQIAAPKFATQGLDMRPNVGACFVTHVRPPADANS